MKSDNTVLNIPLKASHVVFVANYPIPYLKCKLSADSFIRAQNATALLRIDPSHLLC